MGVFGGCSARKRRTLDHGKVAGLFDAFESVADD